ncbi:MAG: nitroreductase family protein [Saccharofermentanales bacterium]
MDFKELAEKRESCRAYLDIPVEREKLVECVEAARLSPSACNSQPWGFIIIDEPALAKQISLLLQDDIIPINRFTRNCNAFIIIVEENANLSSKLGGRFKDQDFAQTDIGIAAQMICLSATDQGLGSCIMGWFNEKKLKNLLGIPKTKRIRLIIAAGYPENHETRPKSRRPMEEIMHFNKW